MVNNNFFKALLLSSAMVGFMLNMQAYAMQDEDPNTRKTIMTNTNNNYAKSLFTDAVLKNEEFKNLRQTYLNLELDLDVDPNKVLQLEEGMRGIYTKYCSQCQKENVDPFVPVGPLSFLGQQFQPKIEMVYPDYDSEMHTLTLKYKNRRLFPSFNSVEALNLIHSHLVPKYRGYSDGFFKDKNSDNTKLNQKTLKFLLTHDDKIKHLAPEHTVILFRVMGTITNDIKSFVVPDYIEEHEWPQLLDPYNYNNLNSVTDQPLIFNVGGLIDGQFVVKLSEENFYGFNPENFNMMQFNLQGNNSLESYRKTIKTKIKEGYNKIFHVCGRQVYNITNDQDLLNVQTMISDWLNVVHGLVKFENEEWSKEASKIQTFMDQYQWVVKRLKKEDGAFYTGVNVTNYGISLAKTSDSTKAEKRETLAQIAEEEYNYYKKKIKKYEEVKPYLSTLKIMKDWFKTLSKKLTKHGRLS